MRKVIILFTGLLLTVAGYAQNRLVTNQYIRTKVTDKTYTQKTGTTIPNDNLSINTANAKTWLVLEERFLPAQAGRMPWHTEIVPMETNITCQSASSMEVCEFPLNYYGPCGSYIYTAGFASNMQTFTRERFAATNPLWNGDPNSGWICSPTPGTSQSLMMSGTGDSVASPAMKAMAVSVAGPLNRCGIWGCDSAAIKTKWIYTRGRFYVPQAGTYYIGVAADNMFRLQIDGADFVRNDLVAFTEESFKIWHIFPITLTAGVHELMFMAKNTAGEALMGCEIYNNTRAQLEAASTLNDIQLLYSTKNMLGKRICIEANGVSISIVNYTNVMGSVSYGAGSSNMAQNVTQYYLYQTGTNLVNFSMQGSTGKVRLHVFSNETLVEDKLINASGAASVTIPAGASRTFRVEIHPEGI